MIHIHITINCIFLLTPDIVCDRYHCSCSAVWCGVGCPVVSWCNYPLSSPPHCSWVRGPRIGGGWRQRPGSVRPPGSGRLHPAQPSPGRSSPILAPAPLLQHILPHEPGSSHTATPGGSQVKHIRKLFHHNTTAMLFCINIIEDACCSPKQKISA